VLYLLYIIQYNYIDIINTSSACLLPTVSKKMLTIRPKIVKKERKKRQPFAFQISSHKILGLPTCVKF
jgi:hypothetical protein